MWARGNAVYEGLLREGVIVRPVAGYGLPRCVRITIGTAAQNERLIAALAQDAMQRIAGPDAALRRQAAPVRSPEECGYPATSRFRIAR